MIQVIFYFANEIILITIRGNHITFANSDFGAKEAPIEGLRLSHDGVIQEFPQLKDNHNWKEEAIVLFKNKIKQYNSEQEVADYIIQDLKKFGYQPKYMQRQGFRRVALK